MKSGFSRNLYSAFFGKLPSFASKFRKTIPTNKNEIKIGYICKENAAFCEGTTQSCTFWHFEELKLYFHSLEAKAPESQEYKNVVFPRHVLKTERLYALIVERGGIITL